MSTVKTNKIQLGISQIANNNFTFESGTDGSLKVSRGNVGSTNTIIQIDNAGVFSANVGTINLLTSTSITSNTISGNVGTFNTMTGSSITSNTISGDVGNVAILVSGNGTITELTSNNTTVLNNFNSGGTVKAKSYNETFVELTGDTPNVNCSSGNFFALTTSNNTTFTFSNAPASNTGYGFVLKITAGNTHTITFPVSVSWAGGVVPDAPAASETDFYVFVTHDSGTNWYGFQAGDALA